MYDLKNAEAFKGTARSVEIVVQLYTVSSLHLNDVSIFLIPLKSHLGRPHPPQSMKTVDESHPLIDQKACDCQVVEQPGVSSTVLTIPPASSAFSVWPPP